MLDAGQRSMRGSRSGAADLADTARAHELVEAGDRAGAVILSTA